MTNEYKDIRYNEGVKLGIEYRGKFCRASFDKSGSCDDCLIRKYNTAGVSCQTFMATNPEVITKLFESQISAAELADEDFMSGFRNGIQMVAVCCSLNDNECFNCPLGELLGDGVDCVDFCADHAEAVADKMAELIENGGIPFRHMLVAPYPLNTVKHIEKSDSYVSRSYYDEFCVRMPECTAPIEAVADCCCRNLCFGEGVCPHDEPTSESCVSCWGESYA